MYDGIIDLDTDGKCPSFNEEKYGPPLDIVALGSNREHWMKEIDEEFEKECNWLRFRESPSPDKISSKKEFTLKEGVLYHKDRMTNFVGLFVPESCRLRILATHHLGVCFGLTHFGLKKFFEHMRQYYWWPSMFADVNKFVLTCNSCLLHKKSQNNVMYRY
jgi:hypothetical protein